MREAALFKQVGKSLLIFSWGYAGEIYMLLIYKKSQIFL